MDYAPRVFVSLSLDGQLQVEIPSSGSNSARAIPLRKVDAGDTLLRILNARLRQELKVGEDGAPSAAQVKHWEDHGTFKDTRCAFCRQEQGLPPKRSARHQTPTHQPTGTGSLRKSLTQRTIKTAEDLGL